MLTAWSNDAVDAPGLAFNETRPSTFRKKFRSFFMR
jgi:hypothetical protein